MCKRQSLLDMVVHSEAVWSQIGQELQETLALEGM
jgi:hypothetical protein